MMTSYPQTSTNVSKELSPKITVIGVGGAGNNAVNNMIASDLQGVEFMVCNTDAQALENSICDTQIQLGVGITSGLGAGSKPEVGRAAAEESIDEILEHLENVNMVFITAGMGGGTGTGAAPVIARAVREKGILTVGVVTKPFQFEGAHRMSIAERGIEDLQEFVDTLIVIPNQNLFRIANEKTTFAEAFKLADSVLQSGVRGVTDLMVKPGLINLDFADIRCAMMEMGKAMMGTGEANGDRRAIEAAEAAINNPLLDDVSMKGAKGVIINITGGMDMTLFDVDEACNRIRDEVDPKANIIFGSTFDDSLEGLMRVSIVATGIDAEQTRQTKPFRSGHNVVSPAVSAPTSERPMPKTTETMTAPQVNTVSSPSVESPSVEPKSVSQTERPSGGFHVGSTYIPPRPADDKPVVKEPAYETASMSQQPSFEPNYSVQPTAPQPQVSAPVAEQPVVQRPQSGVSSPSFGDPIPQTQPSQSSQPSMGYAQGSEAVAVAAQPRPQEKKSPSLFDRLTAGRSEQKTQPKQEQQPAYQVRETQVDPQSGQGSLNIEVTRKLPEETQVSKDDLNIPAFLRRQAS